MLALTLSAITVYMTKQDFFTAFVVGGMIVFLFALKKEDGYIHSRIEAAKEK